MQILKGVGYAMLVAVTYVMLYVALRNLQLRWWRKQDRKVTPEAGQVWMQDSVPLYITKVNDRWIMVQSAHPMEAESGVSNARWQESREDWALRLDRRFVLYRGRWDSSPKSPWGYSDRD